MRIGILTFHRAYNCGAMLQAWALKTVLERMGHTVEFPDCNAVGYNPPRLMIQSIPAEKTGLRWIKSFVGRLWLDLRGFRTGEKRGYAYDSFRKAYLPERHCTPEDFGKYYDLIVIGSDQVFSARHVAEWRSLFYGTAVPSGLPKIAYAGSIGDIPKEGSDLVEFKSALKNFSAISLREPFESYRVVADPTLLMTVADYACLRKKWIGFHRREYIYLYSIETTEFEVNCARKIAKALKCELIISPAYPNSRTEKLPEATRKLSPERMVQYIRGAKYVLAGSFHGTVFSLIHHKPFLTIRNKVNEPLSRPAALLNRLGLIQRRVDPSMPLEEMLHRLVADVPMSAYEAFEQFRQESLDWLAKTIECSCENKENYHG